MRKATKRTDEDTSESASVQEASPPKKTKPRKALTEPIAISEPRLPRLAKSKAVEAATKKPAPKKAGIESKTKPTGESKKANNNEDSDEESEPLPAKKAPARGAKKIPSNETAEDPDEVPKKRGAGKKADADVVPEVANKTGTRGRGKAVNPDSDDVSEASKPGRIKRGKAADENVVEEAPKKGRAKKTAVVAEPEEKAVDDVAEVAKTTKGKKPVAAKPRGKKMAADGDPEMAENDRENGGAEDVAVGADVETKLSGAKQTTKGKPTAKKPPRGKKAAEPQENVPKEDSDVDGDAIVHGEPEAPENEPEVDAAAKMTSETDAKGEERDAEDSAEPTKPAKGKKIAVQKPRGKKLATAVDLETMENESANGDDEETVAAKKGKPAAKKPRGKKPIAASDNEHKDDAAADGDAAVETESLEIQPNENGAEVHAQNGNDKLNSSGR